MLEFGVLGRREGADGGTGCEIDSGLLPLDVSDSLLMVRTNNKTTALQPKATNPMHGIAGRKESSFAPENQRLMKSAARPRTKMAMNVSVKGSGNISAYKGFRSAFGTMTGMNRSIPGSVCPSLLISTSGAALIPQRGQTGVQLVIRRALGTHPHGGFSRLDGSRTSAVIRTRGIHHLRIWLDRLFLGVGWVRVEWYWLLPLSH